MDKIKVWPRQILKKVQLGLMGNQVDIVIQETPDGDGGYQCHFLAHSSSKIVRALRAEKWTVNLGSYVGYDTNILHFYAGMNEESVINALREIGDVEIV